MHALLGDLGTDLFKYKITSTNLHVDWDMLHAKQNWQIMHNLLKKINNYVKLHHMPSQGMFLLTGSSTSRLSEENSEGGNSK